MRKLFLFTLEFPHGYGDIFLEDELPLLLQKFPQVKVFPYSWTSPLISHLPAGVEVVYWKKNAAKSFRELLRILLAEFLHLKSLRKRLYFIKNIRSFLAMLRQIQMAANYLEAHFSFHSDRICYTYWVSEWTLALSILKLRGLKFKLISRCAGFDIYDERYPGNFMPFRNFAYQYLDKLHTNSHYAASYLEKFDLIQNKLQVSYLGTRNMGLSPVTSVEQYRIISCSSLIPLKRVGLIAEAVKLLPDVEWHHFGSGQLEDDLIVLMRDRRKFFLHAPAPDNPFLNYCSSNFVDIFINVSTTEGLPMTVIEALSFGIPILATPAGGTPELINEETGELLPMDVHPQLLAERILTILISQKYRDGMRRRRIREFWEKNFRADHVYCKFAAELISENE
jgi:glycosyltransferase involved in cell wall biosynthesis